MTADEFENNGLEIFPLFMVLVYCINIFYSYIFVLPAANMSGVGTLHRKCCMIKREVQNIDPNSSQEIRERIEDYDYTKIPREVGSGPIRLNSRIVFAEDLYSMYFVTNFKSEYIYHAK